MKNFILLLFMLGVSDSFASKQFDDVTIGDPKVTDPSAMLELNSTSKGFLLPRMTTAQRDLIPAPTPPLQIYNSDTQLINIWDGAMWTVLGVSTLQQAYDASLAGDIILDNTKGAFTVGDDTVTPLGTNLFEVVDTLSAEVVGVTATSLNATQLNVDNVLVDGNSVSTSAGNLTVDSFAGLIDVQDTTRFQSTNISTVPYIDANKDLVSSLVTPTELGFLDGVTSAIQTQLDGKEPTIITLPISKGGTNSGAALANNLVMVSTGGAVVESSTTSTELGYLNTTTSDVQVQLDAKEPAIVVLPIAKGGTGSATQNFVDLTTAQTAAGDKTFSGSTEFSNTGSVLVSRGTTGERDGVPINGMFRYNSTTTEFEGYANNLWGALGGSGGIDHSAVPEDVIPDANQTRDLGASTFKWQEGWFDELNTSFNIFPYKTTPANPAANFIKVYVKSDDKIYMLTSGGTETEIGVEIDDLKTPGATSPVVHSVHISSTGVTSLETNNWISGNCTNASTSVCSFGASIFLSAPICSVTGATADNMCNAIAFSSTSVSVYCTNSAGTTTTTSIGKNLICHGVR